MIREMERAVLAFLPLLFIAFGSCCRVEAAQLHGLAVLEDPTGALSVHAVAARDPEHFRPLPAGSFAGGFTRSAFWFRFVVAEKGEHWLDILPPVLDDLRLYEPALGDWREHRAGDTLPFAVREVPYRGFVFKLRHDDDAPRTYYLRLSTTSSAVLTPRLWRPDDFVAGISLENGLLLAAFAVVATVILLNINAWFWLGDRLTLWFIAHLVAFAGHLLGIGGYLQQYLIPDRPEWGFPFVTAFGFALIATANGFYRRLFGIGRDQPLLYWLYEANCWLPLVALPFALVGHFTEIMPVFMNASLFMIAVGVAMALRLWRVGAPGGGMMLVANLIAMGGILAFVLNTLGAIAGGFFVWHSLQIASLGAMLALQLALGAHARSLRDARLKAEQEVLYEREERIRQGQFLAMLAHELRTSLSVLKMAVGMQPMTPKSVASAERAMTGMGEVIEHSLEMQKLADGQFSLLREPCDIAALLEATIAACRTPEQVRLVLGARPTLVTDAKLLRVIVANLLDNALKYGAVEVPVDVTMEEQGGRSLLSISNAIGPAGRPDPARVFEKYYRAPAAHAEIGSGLGLYVAHALAALLGGELDYRADEARVCFVLRL